MGTGAMLLPVLAVLATQQGRNGEDTSSSHAPPTRNGKPVQVAIGFYVLDFARVTSREESFDITGYLEMSWYDPALALRGDSQNSGESWRRLDVSRIWKPNVFFQNAVEQPKYHNDFVVDVDARGMVTSWVIVSGKFSARMDLRRFPFDRQELPVRIVSFDDDSIVQFVPKPELEIVGDEAFVTDWSIAKPLAHIDAHRYVPGQETYSRFIHEVSVERRATFFVWRVLLPLTLLAMVSFAVFWFEPVGLQPQISTCMASLIALVAFNFAIDFSLPKVTYLTLIDKHALIGFAFVAGAVVEVTLVHLNVINDRLGRARSIQRVARWLFPLGYALAVTLNLTLSI